ncbi:MAG: LysE family translocator [Vulcanimicrobiaceae bacterium]
MLELTLCLIPGPTVLLTLTRALRRGVRGGLATAAGILAGNAVHLVLSGAGVVALLLVSYRAFGVVKWCGAGHLAFLGVRAMLARSAAALSTEPPLTGIRAPARLLERVPDATRQP